MTRHMHILGTAQGVGKTTVMHALCRLLRQRGIPARAIGPNKRKTETHTLDHTAEPPEQGVHNPGDDRAGGFDDEVEIVEYPGNPADPLHPVSFSPPALLVADDDRGDCFAAVCGTLLTLSPDIRRYVKGVILNKYSGTENGILTLSSRLRELTGVPVLAVIPCLNSSELLPPDTMTEDVCGNAAASPRPLEAVALRIPGAGVEDVSALGRHPAIALRFADAPEDVGEPDLVVVPDFDSLAKASSWFLQSGLSVAVGEAGKNGTPIVGLGNGGAILAGCLTVGGIPGEMGIKTRMTGLGVLPTSITVMENSAAVSVSGRINRVTGIFSCLSGVAFSGRAPVMLRGGDECGETCFAHLERAGDEKDEEDEGVALGNVLVTGVVDLFSTAEIRNRLADELLCRKGLDGWEEGVGDLVAERLETALEQMLGECL